MIMMEAHWSTDCSGDSNISMNGSCHPQTSFSPPIHTNNTNGYIPNQDIDDHFQKFVSRSEQLEQELINLIDTRQNFVIHLNGFRQKSHFLQLNMANNPAHNAEAVENLKRDLDGQKIGLQRLLNELNKRQNDWLELFHQHLLNAKELEARVVDGHLLDWKRDQQLGGNGGNLMGEAFLNKIQEWCELLAKVVYRSYVQLKKFTDQTNTGNIGNEADAVLFGRIEEFKFQVQQFLRNLVQNTFLVEKQPPQVMKTNTRFMSTLRLLCGHALNIHKSAPAVKVSIISEATAHKFVMNPTECGADNSGQIANNTSNLDFHESSKQMSANFRNMQLSKIRRTEKKGTESVMDEKFALLFQCHFKLADDFSFYIWTLSLPVVVIVHGNQEPHAWATVTWDNAFAPPGRTPYAVPDKVAWHRVGEVLSMKFKQYVGRPLSTDALRFLAGKAFRMPCHTGDFDHLVLSWTQFAKEPLHERSFTFWEWFYAILKVTREHMRALWAEGVMIGFISRKQTEDLLTACPNGTFLLRFSDSELGGVTIAWIGESTTEVGASEVFMVQPFTSKDFAIRGLADRINDLKNLHYLYPNVAKDQVFGKFYSRMNEGPPLSNGYVKPWLALTLPG